MPMTPEQYKKNRALLDDPNARISPERRAQVEEALSEVDGRFLAAAAQDITIPEAPGAPAAAPRPAQTPKDAKLQAVIDKLDPMHPIVPQGLAISPSTTHPEGDEKAEEEWSRGDPNNPKGLVVVYDLPASEVRKKLYENPQLFKALGLDVPMTAETIAGIQSGDSIHQAYNDYLWPQVADAAVKGGKTAYRYSKAPWMAGGKNASFLTTLKTKLDTSQPLGEGIHAFVMGMDDTKNLGINNAVVDSGVHKDPFAEHNAAHPDPRKPVAGGTPRGPSLFGSANDEVVGGVENTAAQTGASARERSDMHKEESPTSYVAGQVAGMVDPKWAAAAVAKLPGEAAKAAEKGIGGLSHWDFANSLWERILGGWAPKNAVGAAATRVGKTAVAGGVTQGVSEAARAGSNYAETGDTGTTLAEAGGRIVDAGKTAAELALLPEAARVGKYWVREGARYKGLPKQVETLNNDQVYPIVGHVSPKPLREARVEAANRDIPVDAGDVLAERMGEPMHTAAKAHTTAEKRDVGQINDRFKGTAEGRARLPYTNLATTALDKTRERMSRGGPGPMRSVGVPGAERTPKGIFNTNIEGISLTPREGWIPIGVHEVDGVLSPANRARALRAVKNPAQPAMRKGALARVTPGGPATSVLHPPPPRSSAIERAAEETGGAIDRGGHRMTPLKQLPSGEQRGLARAQAGQQSFNRLEESGTRFHGDEQRALSRLEPGGPVVPRSETRGGAVTENRPRPKGPKDGIPDAEFTENGPKPAAPIPDAEFTEQRKPGARPPKKPLSRGGTVKRGTLGQELRKAGVKTVYVAPRRYNATHGESATRQLRRKGADSPNDRDVGEMHQASLRDRDARPMNGEAGGWSKQQQANEARIRAAKQTQKLAAGNNPEEAYQKAVDFQTRRPGQSKSVTAIAETAKRAGGNTLDVARAARVQHSLSKLKSLGGFGREGGRWLFGANALFDAGVLRAAYPAAHAVVKHGKKIGRLRELGEGRGEDERRQTRNAEHAEGYDKRSEEAKPKKKAGSKKGFRRRSPPKDDQ